MQNVHLFSKSLAAKANVGDPVLNLSEIPSDLRDALGEFIPTIGKKLHAIAPGVAAYSEEGTSWTHYTHDSTGAISGVIIRLDGPGNELDGFFERLDQFKREYGLHRREREFILYDPSNLYVHGNPIAMLRTSIYIADSVESLRKMDKVKGTLIRVD